ncbi:MAG: type I polyketide synthase [Desulfobacteraceae bacterium]|nr:MAG: type I polyketide synthase [Desulfobacteraceae bacterium]
MKNKTPIAVVGIAGIFPGASGIDEFWRNISTKTDSCREIPEERWSVHPDFMFSESPAPDKAYSRKACLVNDFKFDPAGIDIDKNILQDIDPLYQFVLHAGREAFSDCVTRSLDRKRTGVALAAIALPTDASSLLSRKIIGQSYRKKFYGDSFVFDGNPLSGKESLSAQVTSLPASILAKGLGLCGGSFTLDAACASSIYAVKLACDELSSYRADAMLAGGVSRPDCLYTQVGFSQLRALSPSGRCAPFDEKADGLVVGEGAGILVLKRLEDAIKDNDIIYCVIKGIGLSNDIGGNLLSPDSEGQVRAMKPAYESAGWNPWDVDLIECHGTGTLAGDTTEIASLVELWGKSGWSEAQCSIGSVKSMIGHLLTGAGAAGMIKALLAMKHKILPPSLNFNRANTKSPIHGSPFRVQTETEKWRKRGKGIPRRAAVSAFGFGGINGHLLFEEWNPGLRSKNASRILNTAKNIPESASYKNSNTPVAIIGMDAFFGRFKSLGEFREAIFNGKTSIGKRPEGRWMGCDDTAKRLLAGKDLSGAFINEIDFDTGDFHIPPLEIPDILLQHLLILTVASGAMKDAGLPARDKRPRMGALLGADFDYGATDFQLRWNFLNQSKGEPDAAIETLRDACSPPLTSSRTLGALGGIIASRIAREFRLGGPSFVVSCDAASGLKALEAGVRLIQDNATDMMLIGAVDLAGDVRNIITSNGLQEYAKDDRIFSFDISSSGTLPGEGAGAIVIKRLDKAVEDNDRIYAVIKGIGKAGTGSREDDIQLKETYSLSFERALSDASLVPSDISYFEAHGSGNPAEDRIEIGAIDRFYKNSPALCAIGSVKPNIGHAGSASGLASLIKAVLCLYHETIPLLLNFTEPNSLPESKIHIPAFTQFWYRDRISGPRRACTASVTRDGNCMHVLLEGYEYQDTAKTPLKVITERKIPLACRKSGLFIIDGNSGKEILDKLDLLSVSVHAGGSIHECALKWFNINKPDYSGKLALSIAAGDISQLHKWIAEAKKIVETNNCKKMNGLGGICYSPEPLGSSDNIAFVFPGSGNHYIGMGRGAGIYFPEILRDMDKKTSRLKTQLVPECFVPWRNSWQNGWENDAREKIAANPLNMIFGQVIYGGIVSALVRGFGIKPSAVIGYSLGESAGNFAMNLWPNHEEMLKRMTDNDLFTTELAGPCNSARMAWNIPPEEDIDWCAAAVNRPAESVRKSIAGFPFARLLIVNTPDECVIGGRKKDVEAVIRKLKCEAVFLEGVVTVHCNAVNPVAGKYKNLHLFPVTPPAGIRFYSCALGRSFEVTSESAADSILMQATGGFDFAATIEQAYKDGIRIFLEMGPHSSCTRMIDRILGEKPHLAVSASFRGENEYASFIKFLGALASERVPADFGKLYSDSYHDANRQTEKAGRKITLQTGRKGPSPSPAMKATAFETVKVSPSPVKRAASDPEIKEVCQGQINTGSAYLGFIELVSKNIEATSEAHNRFLEFSNDLAKTYADTFDLQIRMIKSLDQGKAPEKAQQEIKELFTRNMCLEFATGSVAKVLGPEFAIADTYTARVRLPDEPLMLVDRIIALDGEKCSLGSGKIVTEHDVLPGAWYLDGNRAPICISVEAGQADLFLCSYLGIDLAVKGERTYRLLDATVKFHRGLPEPGDVIRYEIEIEKFVKQKDTYLFFFKFEGYIGNQKLISMRDGCAGFFTEDEVKNSGGIILTEKDTAAALGKKPDDWKELVPFNADSFDEKALESLREGNLSGCFGPNFDGIRLSDSLRLPGGRMKLIDRVLSLDPKGGRFGLGVIRAEADIHPGDWFLTCHFKDDMVMPGTLMYECCAHTLRIFIMRMGWVAEKPGVCIEPLPGIESVLKCRGPVTPKTGKVVYEVELKEIGYDPEPYVLADAYMYADGQRIVSFKDMSMKMTGITRHEIESLWGSGIRKNEALFDRSRILAFCIGKPSEAFGDEYRVFDSKRRIARLPGPPYLFMDRITAIEPEPWILKPGGWIEAEYDVPPDAWYFRANRSLSMPFAVLLETALQPCGWLAAYMGSALKSSRDLKFRNLGGNAVLHGEVFPDSGTLTMRARTKKISGAGDMIIEEFEMQVLNAGRIIYEGDTVFGFFSEEALSRQVGIRDIDKKIYKPSPEEIDTGISQIFLDEAPLAPDDTFSDNALQTAMPSKALRMIDSVNYIKNGGPSGLGYILGEKTVDPSEWFFDAHFYQDPVCPGSLGIESFLQTIRFIAMNRWKDLTKSHRFSMLTGLPHNWIYRGQIIRGNKKAVVETYITEIGNEPFPYIKADGYLKVDGIYIYKMNNFGLKLIPI